MSTLQVRIVARTAEADDICSFALASLDGAALPPFSAGAHIDVEVRPGLLRQYSLCGDPRQPHYEIGVLREPASRGGSHTIHAEWQVGRVIAISAPRNHFALAPAGRSLLLAGGIGITPLLCMAEELAQAGAPFELHYCARSATRAAFGQRLRAAPFAPQVHFHFDDGPAAQRFDAARLLATPAPDTRLYVCGPAGFIQHVLDSAERLGWPSERVHREYFAAPASAPAAAPAGSFQIRIASTGQVLTVPAHRSVAEVLRKHRIEIPLSCEQGVCGSCVTGVLEGVPEHRDVYLSEAEKAGNRQFTPCCSRARSSLLVLDL